MITRDRDWLAMAGPPPESLDPRLCAGFVVGLAVGALISSVVAAIAMLISALWRARQ